MNLNGAVINSYVEKREGGGECVYVCKIQNQHVTDLPQLNGSNSKSHRYTHPAVEHSPCYARERV